MPAGSQIMHSVEELLAEARNQTGINILDKDAIVPLGVLLKSLNEESNLHREGAAAMESRTLRLLCNRLRMQRDFADHPEIANEKIQAPIFLCGMGRTGSTKTHRLLSYSGDFNFVRYWQVLNPSLFSGNVGESTQPRIDDAVAYAAWFDGASPDLKYAHAFEPMEPEEESLILEHCLRTPVGLGWAEVPSYLKWLMTQQDISFQFSFLRDALKYLQWQGLATGTKRWVLKSPLYTGFERELLSVFPDAVLVMTHRHPTKTMASGLRLMELFHKPFTDTVNFEEYVAGQRAAIETHFRNRETIPDFRTLDVAFSELTGPIEPVIKKIYAFIAEELTDVARQRMIAWNEANPQYKKGKYLYSLADYNLTEPDLKIAFAGYDGFLRERFGE